MALVRLKAHHKAYLERTARRLSAKKDQRVSEQDVLHALIDLAIADEGVYDPADPGRPYDPLRRQIVQTERASRTTELAGDDLVRMVQARYSAALKDDEAHE